MASPKRDEEQEAAAAATGLTIGQLAARTGVGVATLRTWEARHGFPDPARSPSGHRRYDEHDVEVVTQVVAQRAGGLSLEAAIERARSVAAVAPASILAVVRRDLPGAVTHQLPKRAMLALSRAVEDEWLSWGEGGVIVGSFQHERSYRQSEQRWRVLAQSAEVAAAFADFSTGPAPGSLVEEVAIAPASPMQREWAIVCAGPSTSSCLVGWERLDPTAADSARRFEAVWTTDRTTVLHALAATADLAAERAPELGERLRRWCYRYPAPGVGANTVADALANRMVAYLVAAGGPGS